MINTQNEEMKKGEYKYIINCHCKIKRNKLTDKLFNTHSKIWD